MDAKPQRPTRSFRVRDENLPPHAAGNKTLHQRNKSTPALSTVLGNAAIKNATKRTAFGDVSNVANPIRSSKDDSTIASKVPAGALEKPTISLQEKPSAVLSRPAQRPMSITNIKGLLNNVTNPNPKVGASNNGASDKSNVNPSDSRKGLLKRSNTVFKDPVLPSVVEANTTTSKKVDLAAIEANLVRRLPMVPAPAVPKHQQEFSGIPANDAKVTDAAKEHVNFSAPTGPSDHSEALRSDGVYIDHKGEVKGYTYEDDQNVKDDVKPTGSVIKSTIHEPKQDVLKTTTAEIPHELIQAALMRSDVAPAALSEPEEYWEEEDEDHYEEDDYVTAPCHRSRGENTTSGPTTLLFPKYNQKVKRDLAVAKQIVEATRTVEDIEDECWDTSMVAEYGDEIFQYMRELEIKLLPNADYMDNQAEIQWSMRAVLMDWLVQVHHRFALLPETLFLCVNYIDRFLSCKIVSLGKLQLVGATALFIASKYEEINCPTLQEIVYMVDGGYTADEILKAERFMLSMLQFELGWPGPMSFLRRISKADDYDLETRTLAKYFLEITIMDERFVGTPPSFAAAGAHCLARLMLRKGTWSPAHVYYSNYTLAQLHPLVSMILECCDNPQRHHSAVFDKYTDRRFRRASFFVGTEIKKGFTLMDIPKETSAGPLSSIVNNSISWRKS